LGPVTGLVPIRLKKGATVFTRPLLTLTRSLPPESVTIQPALPALAIPVGSLFGSLTGLAFASCLARSPIEVNFLVRRLKDSRCPSCFPANFDSFLRSDGAPPSPMLSTSLFLPMTVRSDGPIGEPWVPWLLSEASRLSTRFCLPSRTRVTEPVRP
jgi:hypothetical protein